jgi:Transcriptional regulator C-terminal region
VVPVSRTLLNVLDQEKRISIPIEYYSAFISSAFFGVIEQWLENDVPHSPEEMAKVHIKIVKSMKYLLSEIVK